MREERLALPISIIGPAPTRTAGAEPVESADPGNYHREQGEITKAKEMEPPEIDMSEDAERRLINYLDQEVFLARAERWDFVARLARFKEKYRTKFPDMPKDWPIANASQITVPVIRTAVQTLAARIYQTIMAAEPPASIRVKDPDFQDFAFDYEEFLSLYLEEKIDLPEILDGWVTELIKLGTAILEPTTKLDRRSQVVWDPISKTYNKQTKDVFSGPTLYHIPLEDFWIRPAFQEIEQAPWCGKEIRPTWSQIKDMAIAGDADPTKIDRIWRFIGQAQLEKPKTITSQENLEKLKPRDYDVFGLFELAVRWDVDGDGLDEEIMVLFHQPSRTILRKKYSGFKRRPWRVARFIKIEHWFYGEGMCEILEHLQEEISTMHNQRIDNATIANLRIILVSRLIKGLRPGDRLWTGKVVRVQDVKTDVGTLQIGDVYPSTRDAEMLAYQYAERLSGVGEVASGQAKPVSRTTATAQLALLEELNRRYDKVVKGARRTLRGVYQDLSDLFMESGTGGLAEEWLGPVRGRRLEEFLTLPSDLINKRIKIQVTSTRSTINREVEFQSQIAVWNLLQQMWQQVLQTAQITGGAALVPLLAHEFIDAVKPVFRKIMQYADAPDPDRALSVLTVLEKVLPSPEDLGGMGAARGDEASAGLIEQLQRQTATELGGQRGAGEGAPGPGGNGRVAAALQSARTAIPGGQ